MDSGGRPPSAAGRTSCCVSLPTPLVELRRSLKFPENVSEFFAASLEVCFLQALEAEKSSINPRPWVITEITTALEKTGAEKRNAEVIGAALARVRDEGVKAIQAQSNRAHRESEIITALREVLPSNQERMRTLNAIEVSAPRIQEKVARLCGETPTAVEILRYCREETARVMNEEDGRVPYV